MVVLIDTNVLLDFLLHRSPFDGDTVERKGMCEGHFVGGGFNG